MNDNPAQQVLSDLFGYLESLEAQSGAISRFLKEKGIATDEQLAPYLEQAANAANVKWRAARIRMEHLFAAPDQAPAEHRLKKEGVTKENTDESSALTKGSEAQGGNGKQPAKQDQAGAATDNRQSSKEVDAKAPAKAPVAPEQKTSGDSEHSEKEQREKGAA